MPAGLDSHLLLRAFCDELVRCGVRHAVTSPGSRSTPLVLALARERRLRSWSHVDERSAAFFALGTAKATGVPAAVACTSGTAAANYLPAVVEAHEAGVPMVVLTADRPPELRDVGAGQTIDQLKLFGANVRWFVELDVAEASPERLAWVRQLACRVVGAALGAAGGRPGPVHVNVPLREPLVPEGPLPAPEPAEAGRAGGRPWTALERRAPAPPGARLAELVAGARRPLVVAGRTEPAASAALADAAAALGWPVLADPLSGARRGGAAIAHYDALLRTPDRLPGPPDLVVRCGDLPTSKPLRQWLAALDPATTTQVAFSPTGVWHDPQATLAELLPGDPAAALAALGTQPQPEGGAWLGAWRQADAAAARALDATLAGGLSEPAVARELARALPSRGALVVAASMPVRDVETFWPALDAPARVLANRGANGIDGTASTAFGVAAAHDGPTALLVGDVTVAHDLGGLLAAKRLHLPLALVVLDNAGGGIFDFLPVATQTDVFEEHVATPTGLDLEQVARLFDLGYTAPTTLDDLRADLRDALAAPAATMVHVRTDRAQNVALHRACWEAVATALG
ncbi:2-succinyl-5-enolpyruvyl-6-hydroxy-3-cyclohexene-1-carboxylic-acid synthase [Conexibacter sp. SYSU D00693]|uniref:2-succinyl-5-enolpyruvyl-6-hydroxy-3- cyclohexene-1-carboxylic-acid synthase n=1 Tax=Conexibacter sp. SYSU D00693 TaxID=2812560 RepID=UPI00196AFC56|nr:2-succinyl-5-enolpyruvyl-6-hydroxy-3-cyclohexene-1-carboxylic-acid synthase [Conexibacter sp. SYSU D00693]